MTSLKDQIETAVKAALVQVVGPEGAEVDPLVRPTQDPKFGDFQSNVALGLAKRLGRNPRETAQALVDALDLGGTCETPEIAGPGFINFRIKPAHVANELASIQAESRFGVEKAAPAQRVIIDFSSPNLAKEMHIGHLRSTIIGDTLARTLEFVGHDVLRLNHVGDWGTQFGMLLQHVRDTQPQVLERPDDFRLDNLESFYVQAKTRFDSEPEFADKARRAVVDLQSGNPAALKLWKAFVRESLRHAHEVYERLGVEVIDRGESFYNPMLPTVIEELQQKGMAVENQGAVVIFLDQWTNKNGDPFAMIIRKTDGGYMYSTTDLAAVRQRVEQEHADRVIYVTDVRQQDHFQQFFHVARKAGWVPDSVSLEHVGFGMILGANRKPFATREGGTVKLINVLEEAISRAAAATREDEGRAALSDAQREENARVIGIAAVKYADLSHNPSSDYVFDWDTMLALEGNTAPYMLYAYARVRSIGRKAGIDYETLPADLPLLLEHESELALAKQLLLFPGVVKQVAEELRPHHLTDYLYSLSKAFSTFYDRERGVRVINAESEALRLSRLRLCDLTARALKLGLGLLGISVLEQM